MSQKRERSDSISFAVETANYTAPSPPEGVTLDQDEQVVWEQVCRSRYEWRDVDLILVASFAKSEVQLRRLGEQLALEPVIVEDRSGRLVENPLIKIINSTRKMQLSIVTKLHIMNGRGDARTLNKAAKQHGVSSNVLNLLA